MGLGNHATDRHPTARRTDHACKIYSLTRRILALNPCKLVTASHEDSYGFGMACSACSWHLTRNIDPRPKEVGLRYGERLLLMIQTMAHIKPSIHECRSLLFFVRLHHVDVRLKTLLSQGTCILLTVAVVRSSFPRLLRIDFRNGCRNLTCLLVWPDAPKEEVYLLAPRSFATICSRLNAKHRIFH